MEPLYAVDPLTGPCDVVAELGGGVTVTLQVVADDVSDLEAAVAAVQSADTVVVPARLVRRRSRPMGAQARGWVP